MESRTGSARPFVAVLCFLAVFSAVFFTLRGRLSDGVFIIGNLLPIVFALRFGMRWGITYAFIHIAWGAGLAAIAGFKLEHLYSYGIPASLVTLVLTGAIGRVRDLTTRLQLELKRRGRYEAELQQHRAHLEVLVEERTAKLVKINGRLVRESAEREKAETEKRALETSLKRAEKMEAVGLLAGSVAHDLNNILGSLIGYPELLLLDLPDDSPMRESLTAIQESGMRAAAIVQDLLTMARRGVATNQVIDLNAVVTNVMRSPEMVTLQARRREIQVTTDLCPGTVPIQGSAVHLARAILNLLLNAMEAMEQEGKLRIATATAVLDKPARKYEVVAEGAYAVLTVEDTGMGISHQDLDRIFEPFYSKKTMGRSGTGLGMAIVWGTVKDHRGFLDVTSQPGKGTTFTLFLPSSKEEHQTETVKPKTADHLGRGQTILVVDDVAGQRILCASMVNKLGYAAVSVASGEEAVEFVKNRPAGRPVDLVILDMIMDPGIDGLETYQRILAVAPDQKAIVATGFSETEKVKQVKALGASVCIRKPYTLDELAVAIQGALQKPSEAAQPACPHSLCS